MLDLDATDDAIHGQQEGRFFHGYYDGYCCLSLSIFCGDHLLTATLRRANVDASAGAVEEVARIVGQIRQRWSRVKVLLRADSSLAREALMAWCEANRVDYVFGLARTSRLVEPIQVDLAWAEDEAARTTSAATMRANQLRLWFASMAYVLLAALRRIALTPTRLAQATCGTIRLKLMKIGAQVRLSVRRIRIAMASACPYAEEFALAHARLCR